MDFIRPTNDIYFATLIVLYIEGDKKNRYFLHEMICTGQGVAPSWPIIYPSLGRPTVVVSTMVPDKVPIVAVALSLLI